MWGISRSCASERPFGFSAFQRAPCSLARVFCVRSFIRFFRWWDERSRGAPRGWCRALSGQVHDADLERLLADRDFSLRRPSPLGGCNVDRISQRALRDDVSSFFSCAGACGTPCQGGVRSARGPVDRARAFDGTLEDSHGEPSCVHKTTVCFDKNRADPWLKRPSLTLSSMP